MINKLLRLENFNNPADLLDYSNELYGQTKRAWSGLPVGRMLHAYSYVINTYMAHRGLGALDYDPELSKITGINDQKLTESIFKQSVEDFNRANALAEFQDNASGPWLSSVLKQKIEQPYHYQYLKDKPILKTLQERAQIALMDVALSQNLKMLDDDFKLTILEDYHKHITEERTREEDWHANNQAMQRISKDQHFQHCFLNITYGAECLLYASDADRKNLHPGNLGRAMPEIFQNLITFAEAAHEKDLPPEQVTDILVWHHARRKADLFETANKFKN